MSKRGKYSTEELVALCKEDDLETEERMKAAFLAHYPEAGALKRREEMVDKLLKAVEWPTDNVGIDLMEAVILVYLVRLFMKHPRRWKPCMGSCVLEELGFSLIPLLQDHCDAPPKKDKHEPSQN